MLAGFVCVYLLLCLKILFVFLSLILLTEDNLNQSEGEEVWTLFSLLLSHCCDKIALAKAT